MAGKKAVGKGKTAKATAKDIKGVTGKTAEKVKGGIVRKAELQSADTDALGLVRRR